MNRLLKRNNIPVVANNVFFIINFFFESCPLIVTNAVSRATFLTKLLDRDGATFLTKLLDRDGRRVPILEVSTATNV